MSFFFSFIAKFTNMVIVEPASCASSIARISYVAGKGCLFKLDTVAIEPLRNVSIFMVDVTINLPIDVPSLNLYFMLPPEIYHSTNLKVQAFDLSGIAKQFPHFMTDAFMAHGVYPLYGSLPTITYPVKVSYMTKEGCPINYPYIEATGIQGSCHAVMWWAVNAIHGTENVEIPFDNYIMLPTFSNYTLPKWIMDAIVMTDQTRLLDIEKGIMERDLQFSRRVEMSQIRQTNPETYYDVRSEPPRDPPAAQQQQQAARPRTNANTGLPTAFSGPTNANTNPLPGELLPDTKNLLEETHSWFMLQKYLIFYNMEQSKCIRMSEPLPMNRNLYFNVNLPDQKVIVYNPNIHAKIKIMSHILSLSGLALKDLTRYQIAGHMEFQFKNILTLAGSFIISPALSNGLFYKPMFLPVDVFRDTQTVVCDGTMMPFRFIHHDLIGQATVCNVCSSRFKFMPHQQPRLLEMCGLYDSVLPDSPFKAEVEKSIGFHLLSTELKCLMHELVVVYQASKTNDIHKSFEVPKPQGSLVYVNVTVKEFAHNVLWVKIVPCVICELIRRRGVQAHTSSKRDEPASTTLDVNRSSVESPSTTATGGHDMSDDF